MTHLVRRFALALLCSAAMAASVWPAPPVPGKRGRREPPPHSLSRRALAQAPARLQRSKARAPRAAAASDTLRLVALRVEFPDLRMGESPPADELHDRFYFETQFFFVRQYFTDASLGRSQVRVDVPDAVALAAHEQVYYGDFDGYDSLMVQLAGEAVAFFDPQVDFSRYDGFILLHAGPGQESDIAGDSPYQIWSGFVDELGFREVLSTADSTVLGIPTDDGVLVRECIVLPEWEVQDLQITGGTRTGHLGVYVHEIGQKLGMLPLFDADPSPIPDSQGVGNFCVMGYGLWVANGFIPSQPCAFNRLLMGWVEPLQAAADAELVLHDSVRGPADSVVALVPISAREYFLVSYVLEDFDGPVFCGGSLFPRFFRFQDKNDNCRFDSEDTNMDGIMSPGDSIDDYGGAEWNFFMTDLIGGNTAGDGHGLLVLHVDELALQEALQAGSTNVQANPQRKAVDVEEADSIEDLDRFPDNPRAFGSADDYFVRGRVFAPHTLPDTRSTNGAPTGIEIALVDLPDSTASTIVPDFGLPGQRARVRVRHQVGTAAAIAPQGAARRQLPGQVGADLVALPLADGRSGLVLPGESGAVYVLDGALDEAPVSDGDPATLRPWVTLPPELAGAWVGAPAVGDVDGDAIPEVYLLAAADSLGETRTRLFGWQRDGTGVVIGPPPVLDLPELPRQLLLFTIDPPRDGIVVATEDSSGVRVRILGQIPCPDPPEPGVAGASGYASITAVASPGWSLAGGPAGVRWTLTGCPWPDRGVAWVEADSTSRRARLRSMATCCDIAPQVDLPGSAVPPYRMIAGDLDGDGDDEVVLVDGGGTLFHATSPRPGELAVQPMASLRDSDFSPLAVADLDADGALEILLLGANAMHVLSFSGAERPGWPDFFARDPALENEPTPGRGAGTPLVADLDGDGRLEVLAHLAGGALRVWDRDGLRRHELEAALPAADVASPLLADLDADGRADLAALGRFANLSAYRAASGELVTAWSADLGIWRWPAVAAVAWSELGGDGRHAFHTDEQRLIRARPNDAALPSFVVAPNPASKLLQARVELTSAATVRCGLFNLEGQMVAQDSRTGSTGEIVEFSFDVSRLASGLYLARMELSSGGTRLRPVAIRR